MDANGKMYFHLAEASQSVDTPFAFLATYATTNGRETAQHISFGKLMQRELKGASGNDSPILTPILQTLRRASAEIPLVKELVDSRAIFSPQKWTPDQAFRFLQAISQIESSGIGVKIPNWWAPSQRKRPMVSINFAERPPSAVGMRSMLSFRVAVSLNGVELSDAEFQQILQSTAGLVHLRGQWVEADPEKLSKLLDHWKDLQAAAFYEGVPMSKALRWLAGYRDLASGGEKEDVVDVEASCLEFRSAPWLSEILDQIKNCSRANQRISRTGLNVTLRPYQEHGFNWLWMLNRLGFGGCLADDMGLGKTVQVIAFLNALKGSGPKLLVVPTSLISNWQQELARFAPNLSVFILHKAFSTIPEVLTSEIAITSYSMLDRIDLLQSTKWDIVILDEAQAIKNAQTQQSRLVKALQAKCRFALTGTPVENSLNDLWSIFDFLNPGLLGSYQSFSKFLQEDEEAIAKLQNLVQPYLLRRLKTDKKIIADLPDKTEVNLMCGLSPLQAAIYQNNVDALKSDLETVKDPKQRRGLVLGYLMKFKQICNHPAQFVGFGDYAVEQSGKFLALRRLVSDIVVAKEKLILFTQFSSITEELVVLLRNIYKREGLVLTGDTPVDQRAKLVTNFQSDPSIAFMVLSLKAGGTGLNLTAANHVIHFDRWWNPAVENQATDRAFRIGQKRNVLVHKMVTIGTIEEKIDQMITKKTALATKILAGADSELNLFELSNSELVDLFSLDLEKATSAQDCLVVPHSYPT